MNNKVTFELKDLSYNDLLDTYNEIVDFLKFLDETKKAELPEEENGSDK